MFSVCQHHEDVSDIFGYFQCIEKYIEFPNLYKINFTQHHFQLSFGLAYFVLVLNEWLPKTCFYHFYCLFVDTAIDACIFSKVK